MNNNVVAPAPSRLATVHPCGLCAEGGAERPDAAVATGQVISILPSRISVDSPPLLVDRGARAVGSCYSIGDVAGRRPEMTCGARREIACVSNRRGCSVRSLSVGTPRIGKGDCIRRRVRRYPGAGLTPLLIDSERASCLEIPRVWRCTRSISTTDGCWELLDGCNVSEARSDTAFLQRSGSLAAGEEDHNEGGWE